MDYWSPSATALSLSSLAEVCTLCLAATVWPIMKAGMEPRFCYLSFCLEQCRIAIRADKEVARFRIDICHEQSVRHYPLSSGVVCPRTELGERRSYELLHASTSIL